MSTVYPGGMKEVSSDLWKMLLRWCKKYSSEEALYMQNEKHKIKSRKRISLLSLQEYAATLETETGKESNNHLIRNNTEACTSIWK